MTQLCLLYVWYNILNYIILYYIILYYIILYYIHVLYLTIIRRRRGDYRGIFAETMSR